MTEFFFASFLLLPFLLSWFLSKSEKNKAKQHKEISEWEQEIIDILQKSFKGIKVAGFENVCWTGVMKSRRLILVLISSWQPHCQAHCNDTFHCLFFHLHAKCWPYTDDTADKLFSLTLVATILLGLIKRRESCWWKAKETKVKFRTDVIWLQILYLCGHLEECVSFMVLSFCMKNLQTNFKFQLVTSMFVTNGDLNE